MCFHGFQKLTKFTRKANCKLVNAELEPIFFLVPFFFFFFFFLFASTDSDVVDQITFNFTTWSEGMNEKLRLSFLVENFKQPTTYFGKFIASCIAN